ncbi:hypothetical protein UFOVP1367_37 [uncultured Caudovirales phage]|uniref:Uncharacterized protein n=1 Tax=uncultured Caudovirales phage TaxID=2100421 RepID=A0A6J5RW22_9CAUD|nr:hypothetical protein KNT69_gp37 [uncultured Caudovirales phage]CAB4202771.1 hypothetical protein UFOVP1367_37 [uncultured Caudovirales phage]
MLQILTVGNPYPLKIVRNSNGEGASTQFLLKSGNLLQIVISSLDSVELWSLKKGTIKAGFLYEQGEMLWLFKFFDKNGNPTFTLDAPFNAKLISGDMIDLHNITNENQRLVIDIHVIDNGILKALRSVTMPPGLTIGFLSSVQDQISAVKTKSLNTKWLALSPDELFNSCKTYSLGE